MMKNLLLVLLLILLFLTAAKTHGRQHRLERELEGHWTVSFTAQNHPWVEAFWLRQRVAYWSIAALAAFSILLWRWMKRESNSDPFPRMSRRKWAWILFGAMIVGGSMIMSFIATGLLSLTRLAIRLSENEAVPGDEWLLDAIWGSVGWWLLTAVLICLFMKLVWAQMSS